MEAGKPYVSGDWSKPLRKTITQDRDYALRSLHEWQPRTIDSRKLRIAGEYARTLFNELQHKPLDREFLNRFASHVSEKGEVCDMGCGPGHVARFLHDVGTTVFGLDLSPCMVEIARQLNPDISFKVGSMVDLDLPDGQLAGISAFYSIVNIPQESLPLVFQEMERVLKPGGHLLLAFHVGDEILHVDELWGKHISLDFFLSPPLAVQHHVEAAGFEVEESFERGPYAPEVEHQSQRAYVLSRKSSLSSLRRN